MAAAVTFEGVSKHYRGERSYGALRDDLAALARGRRGRNREVIRALEDINLQIEEGSTTAIIGANGAGKSTALKIISRVTYPTDGVVRVRGRIGALIEVGAGLHPELTGRENVELYGRILGFSGRDIRRRMPEIEEFAAIGPAIDQPVKQFSSGMQLRLGYSIAAHLEPEVLLVDEALSVGDAGFQHRCFEHMGRLKREGRTVVLITHDMPAVEGLCARAVVLRAGRVVDDGPARQVVERYLMAVESELSDSAASNSAIAGQELEITRVSIHDRDGREQDDIGANEPMTVRVHYRVLAPIRSPLFTIGLSDDRRGALARASMLLDGNCPEQIQGEGYVQCTFAYLPLHPRAYDVIVGVHGANGGRIIPMQRVRRFRVRGEIEGVGPGAVTSAMTRAPVKIPYSWEFSDGESDGA